MDVEDIEEIDIQLAKDKEMQELSKLNNRIYQVLIKPNRKLITFFVPKHLQKVITLNSNGSLTFFDFNERATNISVHRVYESYKISDID